MSELYMIFRRISLISVLILSLINSITSAAEKIRVSVSIQPQASFVKEVGGDRVEVEVMVAPGQAPETFEPTPKQLARLSETDLFFRIGLSFEDQLVEKSSQILAHTMMVDLRTGIKPRIMEEYENDHLHGHGNYDPHIWMDPNLVKTMATTINRELKQLDPASAVYYDKNLNTFISELDRADQHIREILAPFQARTFFIFHPVLGYFADRYGLKQTAIEFEGKEPGAKQLTELIDRAQKKNIRVIFVQPQFSDKTAQAVADAIGGKVVRIDPMAADYIANLEYIAEALAEGWQ
nr:zinc ABC transporter substrate-binding protein [candidate division Zixibacteria bacterium]